MSRHQPARSAARLKSKRGPSLNRWTMPQKLLLRGRSVAEQASREFVAAIPSTRAARAPRGRKVEAPPGPVKVRAVIWLKALVIRRRDILHVRDKVARVNANSSLLRAHWHRGHPVGARSESDRYPWSKPPEHRVLGVSLIAASCRGPRRGYRAGRDYRSSMSRAHPLRDRPIHLPRLDVLDGGKIVGEDTEHRPDLPSRNGERNISSLNQRHMRRIHVANRVCLRISRIQVAALEQARVAVRRRRRGRRPVAALRKCWLEK